MVSTHGSDNSPRRGIELEVLVVAMVTPLESYYTEEDVLEL